MPGSPRPPRETGEGFPGLLVPVVQKLRDEIKEAGDIGAARELARWLEACRRYLTDREGRDLVAAETRRTEVLIGMLLGPVEPGERTDLKPSLASEGRPIPKDDRHRFRLLAEHADEVETALSAGVVSRKALLERSERLTADRAGTCAFDPRTTDGSRSERHGVHDDNSISGR